MNAIILAAGMGTRLRPLTDECPKSLVVTAGESFFSRQLRLLGEAGIHDITVVTGYRSEAFFPWHGKPGLSFVHNAHFHDRNNLWSMHLVRERLHGTLVLEGDVWIGEAVLPMVAPPESCWFVGFREDMRNEWVVRTDKDGRVTRVDVESGSGWILSGISYWTETDGKLIARFIEEKAMEANSGGLFWDEIPRSHLETLQVRARQIKKDDWIEVDTLDDRAELEARLQGRTCDKA